MTGLFGKTFDERQAEIQAENDRIRRNYGHALEAVRQGAPGAADLLERARSEMSQEVIMKEKQEINQKEHNKRVEAEYGSTLNPFTTMFAKAQQSMMDQALGVEEIYREKMADKRPSEKTAQDLVDFRRRQLAENQNRADVDPSDYKFDEGYRNVANKAAGFLGGAAPLAAEAYLLSKGMSAIPFMSMPGVWGTGASASREVAHAAINTLPKNILMDLGIDGILGAADQRTTAADSMKAGVASNLLLRLPALAFQRKADINIDPFRDKIDDALAFEEQYGNKFNLLKPSTYFNTGEKLHVDLPFRQRTRGAESVHSAKAANPGFRDYMQEQQRDRMSLLTRATKEQLIPGWERTTPGMFETFDDKFTNSYLKIAKNNMEALPKDAVPVDANGFSGINKTISGTYGSSAIKDDPTVKKHFKAIQSAIHENELPGPTLPDQAHPTYISPEFYESELHKIEKTLKGTDPQTSTHDALTRYKNWLVSSAEDAHPGLAEAHKLGQNQYAMYNWVTDVSDPTSKMLDPAKASKRLERDIKNNAPGIPFDIDIAGKKKNLTHFVGDTAALLDPKKISSATLHDNDAVASNMPDQLSWLGDKGVKTLGLITSTGNAVADDLGSIIPKYNLWDAGFGFSPTQINRVKTMMGTPAAVKVSENNNAEQANQDELNVIEAQKRLKAIGDRYAK